MPFAGHNKGKYLHPRLGYVEGRKPTRIIPTPGDGINIRCPYCGKYTSPDEPEKRCPGCDRPWFKKRNGDFIFIAKRFTAKRCGS